MCRRQDHVIKNIAFGYSTRCNIRCSHCVAGEDQPEQTKMDINQAKEIIAEMAEAGITGISFTAGEPFVFFEDLLELVSTCTSYNIYTRVVTNSSWATDAEVAEQKLARLKAQGLCQLRLSYSRWHQEHVPAQNVIHAAQGCEANNLRYFVSFVTDFSEKDESLEQFLRTNKLTFFPEPVIYAGRAEGFDPLPIFTDYQENRCAMNPYLAPDLTMYGCCDAGSHFSSTHFFRLGNLNNESINKLLKRSETHPLYNCIRNLGITNIASFSGMNSKEIIRYRKCTLCAQLFNNPTTVHYLHNNLPALQSWHR